MVIQSIDDARVEQLNEQQRSLIRTLSMLCSFRSVDDFCSFIWSEKFLALVGNEIWITFEIGSYHSHEYTLKLQACLNSITLIDSLDLGCFKSKVLVCRSPELLNNKLNQWLEFVSKASH